MIVAVSRISRPRFRLMARRCITRVRPYASFPRRDGRDPRRLGRPLIASVERRLDEYDDHDDEADEERAAAQRLPVREVKSHMAEPRDDEQDGELIHRRAGAFYDVRNDHGG